jgi:hypothetical protein
MEWFKVDFLLSLYLLLTFTDADEMLEGVNRLILSSQELSAHRSSNPSLSLDLLIESK